MIQPVTRAARVIGGELPEAQELVFRGLLVGELGAAIVHAIVVVVPHGQVWHSRA
jgi:hypothetical protein